MARLEHAPEPAQLQAWKEALNWFFRQQKQWVRARAQQAQGCPLWAGRIWAGGRECRLIQQVRTFHVGWCTERTYWDWNWRLAKFMHPKPIDAISGEDVGPFLTHLAVELRVGGPTSWSSPSASGSANAEGG